MTVMTQPFVKLTLCFVVTCSVVQAQTQADVQPKKWVSLSNDVVYSQPEKALEYANRAMHLADSLHMEDVWYEGLKARGYANGYAGHIEASMADMQKGLAYYEKHTDSAHIAEALSDIGYLHEHQGNLQKALDLYQQSLRIRQQIGDKKGMAYAFNNLGALCFNIGRYDDALRYYEEAYPIFERMDLQEELGIISGNIGKIHQLHGRFDQALDNFKQAVRINRALGHTLYEAQNLDHIGGLYFDQQNTSLALRYFRQAHDRFLTIGINKEAAVNLLHLGETYEAQGDPRQAIYYLEASTAMATALKHPQLVLKANQALAEASYEAGNYQRAYDALKTAVTANDSLYTLEKEALMTEMMDRFDQERNLLENERLQSDLKQQKLWFLVVIIFSILLLLTLGFWLQNKRSQERMNALVLELKLMRSQLNPHFIHNSLTMMQGAILTQKPNVAINLLASFARLMRLFLDNSAHEFVPLCNELDAMRLYADFQQRRFEDRFQIAVTIDQNLDEDAWLVPPMMVQPFVENAIEHAFKGREERGTIRINYTLVDKSLVCEVEDDGIGLKPESMTDSSGKNGNHYGLSLIYSRIRLLRQRYKLIATLEIIDKKSLNQQGVLIRIRLPLKPLY